MRLVGREANERDAASRGVEICKVETESRIELSE